MARTTKVNKRAMKARKAVGASTAKKIMGLERASFPENDPVSDMELGGLLYWYNLSRNAKDAKEFLTDYLKAQKDKRYSDISKTPEKLIRPTAGWLARMVTHGLILSNQQRDTFERLIDESAKRKVETEETETEIPITVIKKPADTSALIGDVERAVDKWRTEPFTLTGYLVERKVSPSLLAPLIEFYTPLVTELESALVGKERDLKEAYAYLTKVDLKKYLAFVVSIVEDAKKYAEQYTQGETKTRAPRKKKEIPLDKKVALLQYLPEFLEARVRSVDPKKIIGAKELWTFDSVSKRLIVFRAKTDAGLDLHRSSVINYDEANSFAKRIGRNTARILETILINPRPKCREIHDSLTSDKIEITGRINKNTILLKTFVR